MLSKKMEDALNQQINAEMYSAYLYFSMSAYFTSLNLDGFANWTKVQAQEEMTHAVRFYNFVNQSGGRPIMKTIDAPPSEWPSPLEVMKNVLAHERKVTGLINDLTALAESEKDYASRAELQFFITEQVEEEANADAIVKKLTLIKDSTDALFMIDRELATRVFVMPVWLSGKAGT